MSREVEVSLRIPNPKVRPLDENGYPIDHSGIRFKALVTVPAIPKPGESLPLLMASGRTIESKVVRADWNEDKGLFVVSCQYANRSIPPDEYAELANDPVWEAKPLI
jgi:hypothetical protein